MLSGAVPPCLQDNNAESPPQVRSAVVPGFRLFARRGAPRRTRPARFGPGRSGPRPAASTSRARPRPPRPRQAQLPGHVGVRDGREEPKVRLDDRVGPGEPVGQGRPEGGYAHLEGDREVGDVLAGDAVPIGGERHGLPQGDGRGYKLAALRPVRGRWTSGASRRSRRRCGAAGYSAFLEDVCCAASALPANSAAPVGAGRKRRGAIPSQVSSKFLSLFKLQWKLYRDTTPAYISSGTARDSRVLCGMERF